VVTPPLADYVLSWADGVIVGLEPYRGQQVDFAYPDAAVLPGLVNAHVHLDLTHLADQCPPTPDFTSWLQMVIRGRRHSSSEEIARGIRQGIAESLAAGVTLLGDIDGGGNSEQWLANQPLQAVIFKEMLGLPRAHAAAVQGETERWLRQPCPQGVVRGLSPHAPYSVHRDLWFWTARQTVPVATHLAETREEGELLRDQAGPFAPFLRELGVWEDDALLADLTLPLQTAVRPWLIAHANYWPEDELAALARHHVVYCPRTHAAFGHAPHPYAAMLGAGVNVALGTDSLASSPNLDLWQEVRFLWSRWSAKLPPDELLAMATHRGALALGFSRRGILTAGSPADFIVMPLTAAEPDPFASLFGSTGVGRRVCIQGQWLEQRQS
jgi:cytosine/adenosine deaminase-related metal-dependent hydrolase